MKKSILGLVAVMVFVQGAFADCIHGKVVLTADGPSLESMKGEFIGTIENPQGLSQGEQGYFEYSFDNSPGVGDNQAFVTVKKVSSCNN